MDRTTTTLSLTADEIADLYTVSARAVANGDFRMDEARGWLREQVNLHRNDGMPRGYVTLFVEAIRVEIAQGTDVALGRRAQELLARLSAVQVA